MTSAERSLGERAFYHLPAFQQFDWPDAEHLTRVCDTLAEELGPVDMWSCAERSAEKTPAQIIGQTDTQTPGRRVRDVRWIVDSMHANQRANARGQKTRLLTDLEEDIPVVFAVHTPVALAQVVPA